MKRSVKYERKASLVREEKRRKKRDSSSEKRAAATVCGQNRGLGLIEVGVQAHNQHFTAWHLRGARADDHDHDWGLMMALICNNIMPDMLCLFTR